LGLGVDFSALLATILSVDSSAMRKDALRVLAANVGCAIETTDTQSASGVIHCNDAIPLLNAQWGVRRKTEAL